MLWLNPSSGPWAGPHQWRSTMAVFFPISQKQKIKLMDRIFSVLHIFQSLTWTLFFICLYFFSVWYNEYFNHHGHSLFWHTSAMVWHHIFHYYKGESVNRSQMEVNQLYWMLIGFLCVSLGSSSVQLHVSQGSTCAWACSEAGFSSQNGDHAL
jgi:hypothetical protein